MGVEIERKFLVTDDSRKTVEPVVLQHWGAIHR